MGCSSGVFASLRSGFEDWTLAGGKNVILDGANGGEM
jgi:hypothetical protein